MEQQKITKIDKIKTVFLLLAGITALVDPSLTIITLLIYIVVFGVGLHYKE